MPKLGSSLNVNGRSIISLSDGDISLTPDGTGNIDLGNFTFNADQSIGSDQDNYVFAYNDTSGIIGLAVMDSANIDYLAAGVGAVWRSAQDGTLITPV